MERGAVFVLWEIVFEWLEIQGEIGKCLWSQLVLYQEQDTDAKLVGANKDQKKLWLETQAKLDLFRTLPR